MKIVIDIDEDYVKIINKNGASNYPEEVIKNGIPLPKGHGRLIDETELKKELIRCECSRIMYDMLDHTLSYMKPTIEADNAGK